jgi:acetylornithine deacetylase/succinyl-diaminopimelate desuccinylase-like protein
LAEAGYQPHVLESVRNRANVVARIHGTDPMFHGVDERIPVSALESGVRIVDRFLREA